MAKFDITPYFIPHSHLLPGYHTRLDKLISVKKEKIYEKYLPTFFITHPLSQAFLLSSRPLKSKFCNPFPLLLALNKSLACTLLASEVMKVDGRQVETDVFIANVFS